MNEIVIKYGTLALSQQVLERQQGHADKIASYLPAHADIGDSTGALLSIFDPLSTLAVAAGAKAATTLGQIDRGVAIAVGDTGRDIKHADHKVHDEFNKLLSLLSGHSGGGTPYPDLGGPTLSSAGEDAPDGYGDVNSYVWQKIDSATGSVTSGVDDAEALISQLVHGSSGHVTELYNASSFLVTPNAPENPVQDLRWSAGVLLGSIDWVAEKFIGFSILDRCVYHPLAGDWQGIYRASESWHHAADAAQAIAKNHAGVVATTPPTWQGQSGDSFRVAMTAVTGAAFELSAAYDYCSGLVHTISTVCKLACVGIGKALQTIADILLEMAAEAATPVIGWAVGAFEGYEQVQKVIQSVRLCYTILETIATAIQSFVGAKTEILDKVAILENLLEGAARSAA